MSYAVLESALLGIIPIASRVGRVPEILENTPAKKYMFEPRNSEDLANRVLALLAEKPQSIIDMGLKIRDSVVKKLERSSKQITKHILDILNH